MLEPGSFLWSSPHGYQFLRDHHGTLDVNRDRPRSGGHLTPPVPSIRSLLDHLGDGPPTVEGGSGETDGESGVVDHEPGGVVGEYGVEAALG
jgi:hypothetical protein